MHFHPTQFHDISLWQLNNLVQSQDSSTIRLFSSESQRFTDNDDRSVHIRYTEHFNADSEHYSEQNDNESLVVAVVSHHVKDFIHQG